MTKTTRALWSIASLAACLSVSALHPAGAHAASPGRRPLPETLDGGPIPAEKDPGGRGALVCPECGVAPTSEAQSNFERFKSLFYSAGDEIGLENITGWRAGRLVARTFPDEIYGALLLGEKVSEIPGGGPAFAELFRIWDTDSGIVDEFDELSSGQVSELRKRRDASLRRQKRSEVRWMRATGSIPEYRFAERWPHGEKLFLLRRRGDYLFMKVIWNGEEWAYAYFFKDVTPKSRFAPVSRPF